MAMRLTGRGAMKVASKARKLQNFGKAWKVGDKGIVLYPIFKDPATGLTELLVACVWGYRVNDVKTLGVGASFIPSTVEISDDGKPVTPDLPYQFSFLASAFITGEKNAREKALEAKPWPSNSAYKSALEALNAEYDTKNNTKARKPIISRLQLYISTECIYVPMVNDKPDWDNAQVYAQTLSNERIAKLMNLIDEPKFAVDANEGYLEVQYDFVAADNEKSTAGRVAPVGVTPEYRLKNRFPDDEARLNQLVSLLPKDSDIISNHNYSYSKVDMTKLKNALTNYSILNSENLDAVGKDDIESLARSADLIKELSIFEALKNDEIKTRITEELEKNKSEIEAIAPNYAAAQEAANETPPTLQGLMNSEFRADDAESEDLNDVSLD